MLVNPRSYNLNPTEPSTPVLVQAPELLLHGRASKASDVYAFGILLWELTTGLRAFQGKSYCGRVEPEPKP